MKNYTKKIVTLLLSIILLTSCQNELDTFNNNPNDPISVTPSLLLTAMEVSTFANHTSGIMRYSNIFTQHLTGTSVGQFYQYGSYLIPDDAVNNEWNSLYNPTMVNGYLLDRDFGEDYPYYNGMGQILTALNLGYATDMWNDVPYDEAFRAEEGIKAPKYNTQEEIYERLQMILEDAITNLSKPESSNIAVPGDDDYIFHGDTEKWIKSAYVLKARFALRLTLRDGANGQTAAQKALDYLAESGVNSNEDDMNTYFPGTANGWNQWYAFETNRANYLKAGKFFVDALKNTSDPRLPFMVAKDADGDYSGSAPEDIDNLDVSYIGPAFASPDSPVGMVTYAEAKFIEAEANLILSKTSEAKTALEEAVKASVQKITNAPADPIFIDNVTSTVTIENIIMQKYIAMFLTLEPYNDYRRTGFPALIPNQNSEEKIIPYRLATPADERTTNSNATVVSDLYSKVWWDAN